MNVVEKILLSIRTIRNVPQLILDYAGLLDGDIMYKTYSGLTFSTRSRTPDLAEIIVICSGKEYSFTYTPLSSNPTIIDLGAGIGDFALVSNQYFHTLHPKIISLEPDKQNFAYLKKNIRQNDSENSVVMFNEAIFSSTGTAFLETDKRPNDEYTVSKNKNSTNILCNTVTLSDLFKRSKIKHADIIKMDIEGGEYHVLNDSSALKLLNRNVKYIFIEYHSHPKYNYHWIMSKLYNFELLNKNDHVLTLRKKNK